MNIVFLGTTVNYGHKFVAANKKTELLARGLKACGNTVTIHNGLLSVGDIEADEYYDIPEVGTIINYAPSGQRLLEPIMNYKRLRRDLKNLRNRNNNFLILLSPYNPIYEEYLAIGKFLGYKIITISHEWVPTFSHRNFAEKILRKIYSLSFGYGVDAILPISSYIEKRVAHFKKPMFMTPILGEFGEKYDNNEKSSGFVYCGTTAYERAFMILIDAYQIYCNRVDHALPLTLVLSGKDDSIDRVKKSISKRHLNGIHVITGLPYNELYALYESASGLLLPLNPDNEQDKARFSQKIAEYISTGSLLITNPVGEINTYFSNEVNAILNSFSPEGFANSMEWVTVHPSKAREIAEAGWKLGKCEFDYRTFGVKLNNFLKSI